jgi:superfamily II DNA or RNA helicase
MVDLDIKWSAPIKHEVDGETYYIREWNIPLQYRPHFFAWWKINKFTMKERGFAITKREQDWILLESKTDPTLFHKKTFGSSNADGSVQVEPLPNYNVKNPNGLRPWQVNAVSKLVASIQKWGAGVDGSDVGVGKTYTACAVARELDMDILVVCPKAVKESWKRVIRNHFKMWGKCIAIINYESLRVGKSDSLIASYVKRRDTRRKEFVWKIPKTTLIVWDEAQKLKNGKTKNSETCLAALKAGYKMLFCSATMATNPLELRTVGQGIKLFKNSQQYYEWAYRHGVVRGRFGMEFTGDKKALKKLHEDIFINRGVRLSRDTIPNFPESEIIAECYEADKEDQDKINAAYDEMRLELLKIEKLVKKDQKNCAMVAILRARQQVEMLKVPLLIEMAEEGIESGMSVVIFCNFTETINALSNRLNTKCIVNGVVSDKKRQQAIDDFQADKERIILVNIAAGGAGLSLHDLNGNFPRLSLISPSYSAVLMRQSTGRVWRDSAKTKSIQKIVFAANTVEEKVCETVNQKLENLDLLNDGDLNYVQENIN